MCFFGLKKNKSRLKNMKFLDIPLYQVEYVVAVRKHDNINITSFDGIRALDKNGVILTVSGTAANKFLKRQGNLIIDDGAATPSIAIKKLLAHRGRFIFYHNLGLFNLIEHQNLNDKIKILPKVFLNYQHFVAFAKNTSPALIEKTKIALTKLNNDGILKKIQFKNPH